MCEGIWKKGKEQRTRVERCFSGPQRRKRAVQRARECEAKSMCNKCPCAATARFARRRQIASIYLPTAVSPLAVNVGYVSENEAPGLTFERFGDKVV